MQVHLYLKSSWKTNQVSLQPFQNAAYLHAKLSQRMIVAQLGHFIGLLSLSQYVSIEGGLID